MTSHQNLGPVNNYIYIYTIHDLNFKIIYIMEAKLYHFINKDATSAENLKTCQHRVSAAFKLFIASKCLRRWVWNFYICSYFTIFIWTLVMRVSLFRAGKIIMTKFSIAIRIFYYYYCYFTCYLYIWIEWVHCSVQTWIFCFFFFRNILLLSPHPLWSYIGWGWRTSGCRQHCCCKYSTSWSNDSLREKNMILLNKKIPLISVMYLKYTCILSKTK